MEVQKQYHKPEYNEYYSRTSKEQYNLNHIEYPFYTARNMEVQKEQHNYKFNPYEVQPRK